MSGLFIEGNKRYPQSFQSLTCKKLIERGGVTEENFWEKSSQTLASVVVLEDVPERRLGSLS